jgi:hypothetical protein
VIDAAGAIYVIGGFGSGTLYKDVWASTDGGTLPNSAGGMVGGYSRGKIGVLRGYSGVQRGSIGILRVKQGYSRG